MEGQPKKCSLQNIEKIIKNTYRLENDRVAMVDKWRYIKVYGSKSLLENAFDIINDPTKR